MTEIWTETMRQLQSELPPHVFNTWFRPLRCSSQESNHVLVEVPNAFYRERLQHEFGAILREKLTKTAHDDAIEVSYVVAPKEVSEPSSLLKDLSRVKREILKEERRKTPEGLSTRYTFDTFVVGSNNEFAHAAAQASADAPGRAYNPLFIYGGVGLGKTHLLCAIGNRIASEHPNLQVVYRPAEQFTNELITAIRTEKTFEFRARYRQSCDVLLIDDVHFIAGKERTQDEFFHTFNTLYESGRQIVVTSDQYPQEIPELDERLRSRFQWGLQCDIQPPDVETRVAILKKKAEGLHLTLPDDVAFFLANHAKANVRVLEGALIRVAALASLSRRDVTLELTREVFQSLAGDDRSISVELIQKRVAEFFNLHVADLRSSRRHRSIAWPRQVAMYLARKLTPASFPELGQRFGGKDHTTVMHAVQKVERLLQSEAPLQKTVQAIEQTLVS